jgi:hypothetical protein
VTEIDIVKVKEYAEIFNVWNEVEEIRNRFFEDYSALIEELLRWTKREIKPEKY